MINQHCYICGQKGARILDYLVGKWFCLCCFEQANEIFEEHYVYGKMENRKWSNWIRAVLDIKDCFKHSVAIH
jgi:hypothetical protein